MSVAVMPGAAMTVGRIDLRPACLASLHDVMPETWEEVQGFLEWLRARGIPPVSLLIVPGRGWKAEQIDQMRAWAEAGHALVAHGWFHHVENIRGLKHQLHSLFISRNVAEHLALSSAEILKLLHRSKAWFAENRLPEPNLYIPPAWALGPLNRTDLPKTPFQLIEVTRGLLHPQTAGITSLPLTGFEADTPCRAALLRRWNARAVKTARNKHVPLRLSLHPYDLNLRLADQLEEIVGMDWTYLDYLESDRHF